MKTPNYPTPKSSVKTNETESIFFYEKQDDASICGSMTRKLDPTTGRKKKSRNGLWMVTVFTPQS